MKSKIMKVLLTIVILIGIFIGMILIPTGLSLWMYYHGLSAIIFGIILLIGVLVFWGVVVYSSLGDEDED